jgi:hypothetical protein
VTQIRSLRYLRVERPVWWLQLSRNFLYCVLWFSACCKASTGKTLVLAPAVKVTPLFPCLQATTLESSISIQLQGAGSVFSSGEIR